MTSHLKITLFGQVTRLGLYWKVSNQGMLPVRALKGPWYRVDYEFKV